MTAEPRQIVVSLHGIRTRGAWQESLSRLLGQAGFSYDPWKFGFFRAISMINPNARQAKIDWFLERYSRLRSETELPISIVAHSFGSYIVAAAMRQYPQIKFDKIVLCGSIVPVDYDWESVIQKRHQAIAVLNQFGRRDIWVRLAEWVVSDAGPSGHQGFNNIANGRVMQQDFADYTHSQYFFDLNFKENWIPFLKTGTANPQFNLSSGRINFKFQLFLLTILLILIAVAVAVFDLSTKPNTGSVVTETSTSDTNTGSVVTETSTSDLSTDSATATMSPKHISIIFRTDADCHLKVGSQYFGDISASVPKQVIVEAGDYRVFCTSRKYEGVNFDREISATESSQTVMITIAQEIETREQERIDTLVANNWQALQGIWETRNTENKDLVHINCRQITSSVAKISINEIEGYTAKGKFIESFKSQALLTGNFPFNESKYCNNIINGSYDIELHEWQRSGVFTFYLNKVDGRLVPAILEITNCIEDGQSCGADDFGKENVDVTIISGSNKLLFADDAYEKL